MNASSAWWHVSLLDSFCGAHIREYAVITTSIVTSPSRYHKSQGREYNITLCYCCLRCVHVHLCRILLIDREYYVFLLLQCYFLAVVWMKCRGLWAWIMTTCMVTTVALLVSINSGITFGTRDWRYATLRYSKSRLMSNLLRKHKL